MKTRTRIRVLIEPKVTAVNLPNIDLNLLPALDALLREKNVTRAADALHVSQPAMSASLARLRRHFDDPLLERVGQQYTLTPLAAQLAHHVSDALRQVGSALALTPSWDPSDSSRTFRVVTSDYALSLLGGALASRFSQAAPNATLVFDLIGSEFVTNPHSGLLSADIAIIPRGYLDALPGLDLFTDEWVCMVDRHSAIADRPTLAELEKLGWIRTYNTESHFTFADKHLDILGSDLHTAVVVESFSMIPWTVAGSTLIGFVQRRLAERIAVAAGARVVEPRLDMPPIIETMWWHPYRTSDPGHTWFRSLVADAASHVRGVPADLGAQVVR